MGKCVRYVTCSYWETKTFRDWDIYTWPNDSSTHPWNKIDEHSPVHNLIPYHLVCWALASSKQRWSYVLPKAFLMYQRRACNNDRHLSLYQRRVFIVTGMNSVGTHFLFMGWDQDYYSQITLDFWGERFHFNHHLVIIVVKTIRGWIVWLLG